jgi:hypothetical protein
MALQALALCPAMQAQASAGKLTVLKALGQLSAFIPPILYVHF